LIGCVLFFFLPIVDDNNSNGVVLLILLIYCQPRTVWPGIPTRSWCRRATIDLAPF
jgi:hypothetical protein